MVAKAFPEEKVGRQACTCVCMGCGGGGGGGSQHGREPAAGRAVAKACCEGHVAMTGGLLWGRARSPSRSLREAGLCRADGGTSWGRAWQRAWGLGCASRRGPGGQHARQPKGGCSLPEPSQAHRTTAALRCTGWHVCRTPVQPASTTCAQHPTLCRFGSVWGVPLWRRTSRRGRGGQTTASEHHRPLHNPTRPPHCAGWRVCPELGVGCIRRRGWPRGGRQEGQGAPSS